ncbi:MULTISPECIES: cytochrome P450 [unclassified Streptomyces]|uniref:cytochrome P450 n=1 Tax=unclassified Streptomyces TaxID=2593676 RepID=UPI00081B8778|nr:MULTISPECIES: cytochrome P450 [unclassified Streptomyces]MYQ89155.1 cytochrome P450 [Streptomyces sp. SID4936]SCE57712.1 hydroxylation protein CepL [Streptomyces sp. DvalAA-43]
MITDTPDLADPVLYTSADRFHLWREMALAQAVPWTGPGTTPSGFWSVFSHRLGSRVLGPKGPFTSEYGMMLGFDAEHPDHAGGRMIVVTDGARHHALRKLIGPFLSRLKADTMAEFVAREAHSLLDRLEGEPAVQVAKDIGPRLPASVVCEILGIPESDREWLIALTRDAFGEAGAGGNELSPGEAHTQILVYFHELVDFRREHPGDDLPSALLADGSLPFEDVVMNCDNVLVGGNETTRHAITGAFHAAAVTPDLLPALAADRSLIAAAVEETVRWTSPAMHVLRVASEDTRVGDASIRKGDAVAVWLASCNRDPAVFASPGAFRLDRGNGHLGFGHGPHHCLGAAMTRIELHSLYSAMADRIDGVGLATEPSWLHSNIIQGYRALTVDLTWR